MDTCRRTRIHWITHRQYPLLALPPFLPIPSYLTSLYEYLRNFYERALPLQDLNDELKKVDAAFEHEWQAGTLPGWETSEYDDDSPALFCVACMYRFPPLRSIFVRFSCSAQHSMCGLSRRCIERGEGRRGVSRVHMCWGICGRAQMASCAPILALLL